MCDDERALLRNIKANPDDDVARLVYADWLEEHRWEESAADIREQCENPSFEERSHDFGTAVWHRGFVCEYRCTMNAWLANGPLICELNPVERVEITDKSPLPVPIDRHIWVSTDILFANDSYRLPSELWPAIWPNGRVENGLGTVFIDNRQRVFTADSEQKANDWLSARCIAWANAQAELMCHT